MHLNPGNFLADIAHSDLLQFLQHRLLMVYDRVLTALPVESGPTRRLRQSWRCRVPPSVLLLCSGWRDRGTDRRRPGRLAHLLGLHAQFLVIEFCRRRGEHVFQRLVVYLRVANGTGWHTLHSREDVPSTLLIQSSYVAQFIIWLSHLPGINKGVMVSLRHLVSCGVILIDLVRTGRRELSVVTRLRDKLVYDRVAAELDFLLRCFHVS